MNIINSLRDKSKIKTLLVSLSTSLKRTDAFAYFELHWIAAILRILGFVPHFSASAIHIYC